MDIFQKCIEYTEPQKAKEKGIYPYFHEISSRQHSEVMMGGQRTIMLGSNNYLGLTSDDRVIEAAKEALDKYGSGCSGSRFLNGTLDIHVELERQLAEFLGYESIATFSTGFQSNLGIISAIMDRGDTLIYDKMNHASLYDAARLSYAKMVRYEHNDMEALERCLERIPENSGKLIVVDGVFSMEGDLANLPKITELAAKYGARVMVDDSHGIGVMGPGGRGTAAHFGLTDKVDILMGTFSKSFASLGGFVAASEPVVNYIRHVSRPFIFSASMPPSNVAAVMKALEILKTDPDISKRVLSNGDYMRAGFNRLGIPIGQSVAPIIPVVTRSNERTFLVTKALLENGVYVNPVISPAVPQNESILRTSYTATHTHEQLDYALEKFDLVLNKLLPDDGRWSDLV